MIIGAKVIIGAKENYVMGRSLFPEACLEVHICESYSEYQ